MDDFAMAFRAGELINGLTVPFEAKPGEPIEDGVDRRLRGALAVGIFDPQQHFPAAPAGVEPIEQRGARATYMQKARGRGSKACDDGLAHVGRFRRASPGAAPCREGKARAPAAVSWVRVAQKWPRSLRVLPSQRSWRVLADLAHRPRLRQRTQHDGSSNRG